MISLHYYPPKSLRGFPSSFPSVLQQIQLSSTPAKEQLQFTFAYANWSESGRLEEALI